MKTIHLLLHLSLFFCFALVFELRSGFALSVEEGGFGNVKDNGHIFLDERQRNFDILHVYDQSVVRGADATNLRSIYAFDESIITLEPGSRVRTLRLHDEAQGSVNGSDVGFFYGRKDSVVSIVDADIAFLNLFDRASADVRGSDVSFLDTYDDAVAHIRNLELSWLDARDNSTVHVYGTNLDYSGRHLSGIWPSGQPFSFQAFGRANIVLHEVPEPSINMMVGIGLFALIFRVARHRGCGVISSAV